jgi:O-antigen/teichoic acid export membrane protein
MGQFMSLISILILLAGGGIATGVTKYVAEYKKDERQLHGFLSTARSYSLIVSLILFVFCILAAKPLSFWIFKETGVEFIIHILAVAQFGIALNTYVLSVVSGNKDILAVFHYQSLHSSPYFYSLHDDRELINSDRYIVPC